MARAKSKAKKKVDRSDRIIVTWPKVSNYWGGGMTVVREFWVPAYDQDGEPDMESDDGWWDEEVLITADVTSEESCCGFDVLGHWSTDMDFDNWKDVENKYDWEAIGRQLGEEMKKAKVYYCSSYLPDTKEWAIYTRIVEAAGFVPGTTLKTKHGGKYKNVRWEYFGKGAREKAVSAVGV